MKNKLIRNILSNINLQLFADDPAPEATEAGENTEPAGDGGDDDKGDAPKTFTQEDVDRIVNERIARERKASEKALKNAKEEAAKYAKMSEDERRKADEAARQKEIDDLKAENARLQAEALRTELGKSAAVDLEKKDITVTPDVLAFVVGPDAETTKANTDKFIKAILADRKAQEVKRATKATPKTYGSGGAETDPFAVRMKKYGR